MESKLALGGWSPFHPGSLLIEPVWNRNTYPVLSDLGNLVSF